MLLLITTLSVGADFPSTLYRLAYYIPMEVSHRPATPAELRELYGNDPERILGMRLRALREETGMSQAEVAEAMTRQGFSMHQTTIAKIEANDRAVTVNEGAMLAAILGLRLPDLLADPEVNAEVASIRAEWVEAQARRQAAETDRRALLAQRARLDAQMTEAGRRREKAEADEADAWRRYRLARRHAAGHSASGSEG